MKPAPELGHVAWFCVVPEGSQRSPRLSAPVFPGVSGLQAAQVLFRGPGQVSRWRGGAVSGLRGAWEGRGGRTRKAEARSLCFLSGRGGGHMGVGGYADAHVRWETTRMLSGPGSSPKMGVRHTGAWSACPCTPCVFELLGTGPATRR